MNNEINLIEGERGKLHVTSDDARTENALMFGIGRKVLNIDNSFEASMTDRNTVRITSGVFYNNGMFIRIDRDTYMDVNIENGLPGTYRNDLICIRYARDIQMQIETASLVVKKGTASETEAIDPTYTVGNVLEFENLDEFPLYRVSLDGVMPTLEPMFVVEDALDNFSIYKEFIEHLQDDNNPHEVTKKQLEIEKVDNTSDLEKPLSTKQKKAIEEAVTSANEYTDEKISNLSEAAQTTLDALKQIDSIIETKAIASYLSNNENPTIQDSTNAPLIYGKFKGYTLQDVEPTPDNPVEINGLAKGGAIEVKTCGKNKLNSSGLSENTKQGITSTPVYDENGLLQYVALNETATNNYYQTVGYIDVSAGEKYILSGCPSDGAFGKYMLYIPENGIVRDIGNGVEYTPEESARTEVAIFIWNGVTVSNLKFYPMLRLASETDDTYEPYTETTAAIPTDAPLYEGDYIEIYADGSGKLVRAMAEVVFDGSDDELWNKSDSQTGDFYMLFTAFDAVCKPKRKDNITKEPFCSHLKSATYGLDFAIGNITVSNVAIHLWITDGSEISDIDEYKAWLAENPITVVYELEEPTETPLTAEQVAQFKQLYTFEPVTNVFCDGEVELLYYKNTDNGETVGIVHKKVEASEKAIENMQTVLGGKIDENTGETNVEYSVPEEDEGHWYLSTLFGGTVVNALKQATKAIAEKIENLGNKFSKIGCYIVPVTITSSTEGMFGQTAAMDFFFNLQDIQIALSEKGITASEDITGVFVMGIETNDGSLTQSIYMQPIDLDFGAIWYWVKEAPNMQSASALQQDVKLCAGKSDAGSGMYNLVLTIGVVVEI